MERAYLSAAYKFYCGESLENAHSAEADTLATYEILKAQLDRYPELDNDMKSLSEFTTRKKIADFAGMIALIKMMKKFYFGKHKGVKKSILEKEPGYFSWIQNADFPLYKKRC
jgi:DNA polymerase-3 subunit epsilon